MKRIRKKLAMVAAAGLWTVAGSSAFGIITWDLQTPVDGTSTPPSGFLRVSVENTVADTVQLTVQSFLQGNEKLDVLGLNLDASLLNLDFSSFTKTGTFSDPLVRQGEDAYQQDGAGKHDIEIQFGSGNAASVFSGTEAIVYTLSKAGLDEADFNYLSAPGGGNGVHYAIAHIQSIGTGGTSAWVGPGRVTTVVPEPSTYLAGALVAIPALVGVGRALARRRQAVK